MYLLVYDLMQNATGERVAENGATSPFPRAIRSGDLTTGAKIYGLKLQFPPTYWGYRLVNAIGIVGEDIHQIIVRTDKTTKQPQYDAYLRPLVGLNRWLNKFDYIKEEGELLNLSELVKIKLRNSLSGKPLFGLNRWLGQLEHEHIDEKQFNYIHLYLFNPFYILNDSEVKITVTDKQGKATNVRRLAIGFAFDMGTSNKVEFGAAAHFKEEPNKMGGYFAAKPNYYKREVNVELPYQLGFFEMADFEEAGADILRGMPLFAYFDEDKIPIDYFYGALDKIPVSSKISRRLYTTKLKLMEAL